MSELAILGLGTWSPKHADWPGFCAALASGDWPAETKLQPERIEPRDRRRAPQLVKLAIEVMDQSCTMASLEPAEVCVVFSSAMGDMQITDYMCRALAQETKLISPTKFHNSVHNAAAGYWSMVTGAHGPASAVSAFEFTASMAFLEAAIQALEENTPVVVVTQEMAAPLPLMDTCPSELPFSSAFLLAPKGLGLQPLCTFEFSVLQERSDWPSAGPRLSAFDSNMNARLLPLMAAIAENNAFDLRLPLSDKLTLSLTRR